MADIRRRRFLAAGAMLALAPRVTCAQLMQAPRVGVLMSLAKDDPETVARLTAFAAGLRELGWREADNIRVDYRFAGGDAQRMPKAAKELLDLRPDVVLASGTTAAVAFRNQTRSVPVVFVLVPDPVGVGLLRNLIRPEGNITGIVNFDLSIASKWLQVLKQSAPAVEHVAVVFDASNPSWPAYLNAVEKSARHFNVDVVPTIVHNAAELKRRVTTFAKEPNGALIVLTGPSFAKERELLIALAAAHRLPAIYPYAYYAEGGGLMSYGIDVPNAHRQAASYIDQILKGKTPADLPVQEPAKLELVINLKTARAQGIRIPPSVRALAGRVID